MARNIRVEKITQTPIEKQEIEIVERKGVGHPDSMADGFAEAVSARYATNISKNSEQYFITIQTRSKS